MPRLDRHISEALRIKRKDVRLLVAQGRLEVDGEPAVSGAQRIGRFSRVRCDGKWTQFRVPRYLMLHKPPGVVSATRDRRHRTVIDLLPQPWKDQLHIVGRLDFNSTGLLLLSNDGCWSRQLSLPESKLPKRYRVRTEKPLCNDQVEAFERGLYLRFENITTRPAQLRIVSEFDAEVILYEGRYHQIKRMFGQFDNKVLNIHRLAIGAMTLDSSLGPGESRELTPAERRSSSAHS